MNRTEPTNVEKLRGLPWSIFTNATNTVFVQFIYFGSVFVLFLDSLGFSKLEIGITLSLVPFSALIAPFVVPLAYRFGNKRTFVIFYGARKLISVLLLLTPAVLIAYGEQGVFYFIVGVVASFAIVRSIEETAYYPWIQEFVPNSVRGKYSAMSNIYTALVGLVAAFVAGYVLERTTGLTGFMWLFAVGVLFGFVSVWASTHIPGGASPAPDAAHDALWRSLFDTWKNPSFRRFLYGLALITIGTAPLASFLPLYMQEEVGLSSGSIILLQIGILMGGLLSGYAWGWAADRYGSRPIMLLGASMLVIVPIFFWLTPKHVPWSLYFALTVAFFQGIANLGWGIGSGRLLFVGIVPAQGNMPYMALFFVWVGVVTGISQLGGGWILQVMQGFSIQVMNVSLNAYFLLFLISVLLSLLSIVVLQAIPGDSPVGMSQFAGNFLRGNPFSAMGSMIRFYRARDEQNTVLSTARMGETRSPLTVTELISSLGDPRFNVRFEAIIAIGRMPPDQRLTSALIQILKGKSPALSVVAAWALGRIGDAQAVEPLRDSLDAQYRSVQAHSARSLGTLGDIGIAPLLIERMASEEDEALIVAYASALGQMGMVEAIEPILELIESITDEDERLELALALARIIGQERHYIQLWRNSGSDLGTSAAQALYALDTIMAKRQECADLRKNVHESAQSFAHDDFGTAVVLLARALRELPTALYRPQAITILNSCATLLEDVGDSRIEYIILALHTLRYGLEKR
jgi:HEAT repeat protein/Na+/melibiose symporter-like transporter